MTELIINADDLGISPEVNQGIFHGIAAGIITDTSLMVKRPSAQEAAQELRRRGIHSAGIHVDLDALLGWSSPGKEIHARHTLIKLLSESEFQYTIDAEIRSQIETFLDLGLLFSHIDTHHHVHGFLPIFRIILSLAKEYHIPALRFSPRGYRLPGREDITPEPYIINEMQTLLSGSDISACAFMHEGAHRIHQVHSGPAEMVVHPGIQAEAWRNEELDVLLSANFQKTIHTQAIGLRSFADLFSNR